MPRSVKTALAVLTDRVLGIDKIGRVGYNPDNHSKGEYAVKISCLFAAALAAVNLLAAKPVATSVTARQRYPWNGKVDIVVTFSGASNDVAETACVFAATNSATKAALAMSHVTDAGTISGSGTTWTRRYVWDAAADLGEVKIADVVLAAEATTHLGAPWRMPTDAEFAALINNCTTTWTTRNGVYGRLVTGKGGLLDKEHLPSRCRQRPRLLPPQPRLVRRLLVLHAGFGQLLRVGPLLRFEKFLPGRLRLPPLRCPGASSPRICQVARELRARPIHSIDLKGTTR